MDDNEDNKCINDEYMDISELEISESNVDANIDDNLKPIYQIQGNKDKQFGMIMEVGHDACCGCDPA